MKRTLGIGMGILIVAASVGGCTKEETLSSANIKTAGIAAVIVATAWTDNASTVEATLLAGGDESNTYIILDNGDKMYAEANGEKKTMTAESEGVYAAEFATGAGGTAYKVSLERPEDTTADNSTGALPEPFSFQDLPTAALSRATDDLVIKLSNGGSGSMELEVDGTCIYKETFSIASGSTEFTIGAGELKSTGVKPEDQKECDIELTMTREVGGSADSAFDNESSFKLRQKRRVTIPSAP